MPISQFGFKVHDRVSLAVNKGQIRMHLSKKADFGIKNPLSRKLFSFRNLISNSPSNFIFFINEKFYFNFPFLNWILILWYIFSENILWQQKFKSQFSSRSFRRKQWTTKHFDCGKNRSPQNLGNLFRITYFS